ncbi:uncharacterized protein LOC141601134 [Silene latifolia]|uniref:uncharacterized protein LOC141601134 n=1 Tax=Silene latifolia TaxID=37657 RepID=UPI003D7790F9
MTRHESRLPVRTEGGFVANFRADLAASGEMVDKGRGGEALASHGVKPGSLNKVVDNLCNGWSYITNHGHHEGGRIWVMWRNQKYSITIIDMEAQFIHLKVRDLVTDMEFYVTYVYGFNKIEERLPLWDALIRNTVVEPWIVLGDFNNFMHCDEKIGLPPSATRVFSRIDRVLVNEAWSSKWPDYYAYYAPEGDYDHCPCFIIGGASQLPRKKPFKFYNMWTGVPDFMEILKNGWNRRIHGTQMYIVVRKLKMLKPDFKNLNKELFSDVEKNAEVALNLLMDIQKQLQLDPTNRELMDTEYTTRASYHMLAKAKDEFLKQKAKVEWAKEGDTNSAMIVTNGTCVQEEDWVDILKIPNMEEIKSIVFSIPDDKSPGPDGYSSCFFKAGWETIKVKHPRSVKEFRPLACCNTMYKIIAKILCARLAPVLPKIISPNQAAFIKGGSAIF